jgi:biopolymer transport protein ExbB/TolQ
MNKFVIYGGIIGAVASATIIGILMFQLSKMNKQIDELNNALGAANLTIEFQEEVIFETQRQQKIINDNIRQFNQQVQTIVRQSRPQLSDNPDSKELSDSINDIFDRFNEVSR